jgi:hypothetical protein
MKKLLLCCFVILVAVFGQQSYSSDTPKPTAKRPTSCIHMGEDLQICGKELSTLPNSIFCQAHDPRSDLYKVDEKKDEDLRIPNRNTFANTEKIEDLGETCGGKVTRVSIPDWTERYFIYRSYDCSWEQEKKLAEATFRTPKRGAVSQMVTVSIGTASSVRGQYEMIVLKDGKPIGRAMSDVPSVSSVSRYGTSYSTVATWETNKPILLPIEVVVVNVAHGERVLHYRIDLEN